VRRVVAGGGVSANRYLRKTLTEDESLETYFPSMRLCTDNGAMIAALGYHMLERGERSSLNLNAAARVSGFRKPYP
jgi:N6-L-threonylcarbamoyladenine synthase